MPWEPRAGGSLHTVRLADYRDWQCLHGDSSSLLPRGWGHGWQVPLPRCQGCAESRCMSCEHGWPTQPVAQSPRPLLLNTSPVGVAAAPPRLLEAMASMAQWMWNNR